MDDMNHETVDVSREAIATLAAQAAGGVEGVTVCQRKTVDTFTSRMRREFVHKGIKVDQEDDGAYRLTVCLRVRFGVNLPSLAQEVRKRVKEYVEGLTEVEIEQVEVVIEDIEISA